MHAHACPLAHMHTRTHSHLHTCMLAYVHAFTLARLHTCTSIEEAPSWLRCLRPSLSQSQHFSFYPTEQFSYCCPVRVITGCSFYHRLQHFSHHYNVFHFAGYNRSSPRPKTKPQKAALAPGVKLKCRMQL